MQTLRLEPSALPAPSRPARYRSGKALALLAGGVAVLLAALLSLRVGSIGVSNGDA